MSFEQILLMLLQPNHRLTRIGSAVVHPQPVVHATMGSIADMTHFHADSAYALIASTPPPYMPGDGESTDIKSFTRDEIRSHPQIDNITRDNAVYILDEIVPNWKITSPVEFII
jgi:hypothetical protein